MSEGKGMTLQEAIEEIKGDIPESGEYCDEDIFWADSEAIATILNAVVKGELK